MGLNGLETAGEVGLRMQTHVKNVVWMQVGTSKWILCPAQVSHWAPQTNLMESPPFPFWFHTSHSLLLPTSVAWLLATLESWVSWIRDAWFSEAWLPNMASPNHLHWPVSIDDPAKKSAKMPGIWKGKKHKEDRVPGILPQFGAAVSVRQCTDLISSRSCFTNTLRCLFHFKLDKVEVHTRYTRKSVSGKLEVAPTTP